MVYLRLPLSSEHHIVKILLTIFTFILLIRPYFLFSSTISCQIRLDSCFPSRIPQQCSLLQSQAFFSGDAQFKMLTFLIFLIVLAPATIRCKVSACAHRIMMGTAETIHVDNFVWKSQLQAITPHCAKQPTILRGRQSRAKQQC
jgi:hypothetical protein